jgi:bifunctional ADP-heptose synthase (sugar kinase/adenylyltransferase)
MATGCPDFSQLLVAAGDLLVVAPSSEASEGPRGPSMPLAKRAQIVAALRRVDAVTWFDEPDLVATLRELRPDVDAKGTDCTPQTVRQGSVDEEIEIAIRGDPQDRSTTAPLARSGS